MSTATAALNTAPPTTTSGGGTKKAAAAATKKATKPKLKHKRRYCRMAGCTSIVKSQGLCQRHGAKPRTCKVEACTKQAQGNFDGMCKSHFKAHRRAALEAQQKAAALQQRLDNPQGENQQQQQQQHPVIVDATAPAHTESVYDRIIPASVAWKPGRGGANAGGSMPLVQHLRSGFVNGRPTAWHRNDERRARGLTEITNPATQLEGWERELVWMEILLLTGNPAASFRHLARGWGRDKGFHTVLAQFICERHGNVDRKKRQPTASSKQQRAEAQAAAPESYLPLQSPPRPTHPGSSSQYVSLDASTQPLPLSHADHDDALAQEAVDVVGAAIFDDTLYGDAAYNEALAADLFTFDAADRQASMAAAAAAAAGGGGGVASHHAHHHHHHHPGAPPEAHHAHPAHPGMMAAAHEQHHDNNMMHYHNHHHDVHHDGVVSELEDEHEAVHADGSISSSTTSQHPQQHAHAAAVPTAFAMAQHPDDVVVQHEQPQQAQHPEDVVMREHHHDAAL